MLDGRVLKTTISVAAYVWPDPFASDRQYEKFSGDDIAEMDPFGVYREIKRIEFLQAWRENRETMIALDGSPMTRGNGCSSG